MKWFLIMWVCIADCGFDELGVQKRRVEMHLTAEACEWARREALLARGYVTRASCEARPRMPAPTIIFPEPRPIFTPVAEARP